MIAWTLLFGEAMAATWTVGPSGADFSDVGSALAAASSGDRVEVASGTYTECLDLGGKDLTLVGEDAASTTLQGDGSCESVLVVDGGATASVSGFTFVNSAGRGVELTFAQLTLTDVVFSATGLASDSFEGGGVRVEGGDLEVEGSSFTGCVAGNGGAIYGSDGSAISLSSANFTGGDATYGALYLAGASGTVAASALVVEDSILSGNTGGVIYVGVDGELSTARVTVSSNIDTNPKINGVYVGAGGSYTSEDDVFYYNQNIKYKGGGQPGGAISMAAGTALSVSGGDFSYNRALNGGAIYVDGDGSTVSVSDSAFTSNTAYAHGGAMYVVATATGVAATSVAVSGSSFTSNQSGWSDSDSDSSTGTGGAITALAKGAGSAVQITGSTFTSNEGAVDGGAVFARYMDDLIVADVVFSNNNTHDLALADTGGAMSVIGVDRAVLERLVAEDNQTGNYGGALYVGSCTSVQLLDATIVGNSAGYYGGGLALLSVTDMTITGSTFAGDYADSDGGAIYLSSVGGTWANNAFVENGEDSYLTDYGGAIYQNYGAGPTIINSVFLGNQAKSGGVLYIYEGSISFINDVFAYNEGTALTSGTRAVTVSLSYDDWYNNDTDVGGLLSLDTSTSGHTTASPDFVSYTMDGDPDNDDYALADGSALIDAGDPSVSDPDGSRSDIGIQGGPGADWPEEEGDTGDTAGTGDSGDTGEVAPCGPSVHGALTVGADGDCATLVAAVASAVEGDRLELAAGTYSECVKVAGLGLTIVGVEGASSTSLVAPSGCDGALTLDGAEGSVVTGLTLSNSGGSCVRVLGGSASLSELQLTGCGVEGTTLGGGVYAEAAALSVSDSDFVGNAGRLGAGIYASSGSTLSVVGSAFTDDRGGDVWVGDDFSLESQGNTFTDTTDGRAITAGDDGALTSTDDVFSGTDGGLASGARVELIVSGGSFERTDRLDLGAGVFAGEDGSLEVTDSAFTDIEGYGRGGAIYSSSGTTWSVVQTSFQGNGLTDTAADGDCGGLYAIEAGTVESSVFEADLYGEICAPALTIEQSDLFDASTVYVGDLDASGLVFRGSGGGAAVEATGAVTADDVVLRGAGELNVYTSQDVSLSRIVASRDDDSGLDPFVSVMSSEGAVVLEDSWFCGDISGKHLATVELESRSYEALSATVRRSVFVDNTVWLAPGGGLEARGPYNLELIGNTFVGNDAGDGAGAYIYAPSDPTVVTNNLFAYNQPGNGVEVAGDPTVVSFTYNDWYENLDADVEGVTGFDPSADGNTTAEPGLVAYSADGDCSNDQLWLDAASALVDAGDPSLTDDDGTRSDIGAWGPDGAPELDWDGDRFTTSDDCDDWDPDVHPGATERCGGVDEDCDGLIDEDGATGEIEGYADIDGDGYGDAAGWTTGCDVVDNSLDCDDGDPDAWPGAAEVPGDGVDQDCDGEDLAADTGRDSGGGGDSAADTDSAVDTDSAADTDSPSDSDSGGSADTADSGDDTTPPPDAETTGCGGGGEEKATGCGSRALLWLGPIGAASLLRRRRSSLRRSGSGR